MKKFLKLIAGLAILAGGFAITALLWITRPEADRKEEVASLPVMRVIEVERGPHTFRIPSQGIVEADRRSLLASEVAGKVDEVSPYFEAGHEVKEGDLLVQIELTDYEAAVAQAKSAVADAESALANEEARAEQAKRDWKRLGREGNPPDLAARGPQVRSAKAREASARAALAQARKNLDRASIRAPYDGVLAMTATEKGSYLTPGSPVAEIFADQPYEVRLPLSVDEAGFLAHDEAGSPAGSAVLSVTAAGITREWNAKIVRSEGEIDRETRSLFVVAEIGESTTSEGVEMRPGLFVNASIDGRRLPDIATIPFRAFRDLDTLVVVDPDDRVRFRDVNVIHRDGDVVYVTDGIAEGERVSLTELPDLVEGMKVAVEVIPSPLEAEPAVTPNTAATNEP